MGLKEADQLKRKKIKWKRRRRSNGYKETYIC